MGSSDPDGAGVGGWLAFLVLVLAAFRPLALLISTYSNLYGNANVALYYGGAWTAIQLFEWLLVAATIGGCWYLAWRLNYRQVWRTVQLTIGGLWLLSLGYQLVEIAGVSVIAGTAFEALLPFVVGPLLQGVIFSFLWSAYLLRSKRVANTYPRYDAEVGKVFT